MRFRFVTIRVALGHGIGRSPTHVELVVAAKRLGAGSVWFRVWAQDALTPLAFLAAATSTIGLATAIIQLGSRTPALLAMSAMALQRMSGGRFSSASAERPAGDGGLARCPLRPPGDGLARRSRSFRALAGGAFVHDGGVTSCRAGGPAGPELVLPPANIPSTSPPSAPNLELTGELADGWIGNSSSPSTPKLPPTSPPAPLAPGAPSRISTS